MKAILYELFNIEEEGDSLHAFCQCFRLYDCKQGQLSAKRISLANCIATYIVTTDISTRSKGYSC